MNIDLNRKAPIGVFDSGVGGLTVAREIMRHLPNENIVYFGDTARVPYGSKSRDNIIRYSRQIVNFLKTQGVKAIVIACNTASALALEVVQMENDIPIIGVIEPGARAALGVTQSKKIGVIGTEATIRSQMYDKIIQGFDTQATVILILHTKTALRFRTQGGCCFIGRGRTFRRALLPSPRTIYCRRA